MKISVFGCGPSGLLAAHTAVMLGHNVEIFSEKVKSRIGGAQYLHSPVKGVTSDLPDGYIAFMKMGDRPGYAGKVYGDYNAPVSWDNYASETVPAWSMNKVYDRLWDKYESLVQDMPIDADQAYLSTSESDLVISSIPKPALCYKEHDFRKQDIILAPHSPITIDNVVIYSGRSDEAWYRTSKIFGESWTEFAVHNEKERLAFSSSSGARPGIKPTVNNCDCHPDIVRVGRFGRWEKGVLVHHVMNEVEQWLAPRSAMNINTFTP